MQEGSLGDLIDIETRVYDDGVAFRYVLPKSTPLLDLYIADEVTEFRFAAGKQALDGLHWGDSVKLPFLTKTPDRTWVAITEARLPDFPPASLAWLDENTLVTRLPHQPNDIEVAYSGHTPFVGPWRVIVFGKDRDRLLDAPWLKSL
jgi:alpha-glucosidase